MIDVRGEAVGEVVENAPQPDVVRFGWIGEVEVPHVCAALAPGGVLAGELLFEHARSPDVLASGDAGPDDFGGELGCRWASLRWRLITLRR